MRNLCFDTLGFGRKIENYDIDKTTALQSVYTIFLTSLAI